MLKLTTDKYEASRGLSATAELLVEQWRRRGTTVWQKTGQLWLIWHNFTNSQRSLICFGTDTMLRSFKIDLESVCGFHNNSSDLTHLNRRFLCWLRTTCGKTIVNLCQCRKTAFEHVSSDTAKYFIIPVETLLKVCLFNSWGSINLGMMRSYMSGLLQ